ncbi:MAG: hypothetical protein KatS3mg016_1130 [Fimbriimonadales bacterium]|nr:MAG: hypothetical protein KatS3mg016_1130 [Fimbriimonadales bacterium]
MELPTEVIEAVQRWHNSAMHFYRGKGLSAADAEDCAAEMRLRLLRVLQRGGVLSEAYYRCVLWGVLADFLILRQQCATVPMEETMGYAVEPPSVQALALREALERLSPADRELLWRCDGEGCSVKDLVQEWGVREDCLRQRLRRARHRLRQLLGVE